MNTDLEKQIIKTRQMDREQAIIRQMSTDSFEDRFKVHIMRLEDGLWYAECQAHSFLTQPYERKDTARLIAELHVKYFHVIRRISKNCYTDT